jgi:hypothetical protein
MLLRTVSIAVLLGVTGCGGNGEDIPQTSNSESTASKDYTLDSSNSNVSIKTSYPIDTAYIVGNNNIVKFETIPDEISVIGNDNTIYKPSKSVLRNSGNGNLILKSENDDSAVIN